MARDLARDTITEYVRADRSPRARFPEASALPDPSGRGPPLSLFIDAKGATKSELTDAARPLGDNAPRRSAASG